MKRRFSLKMPKGYSVYLHLMVLVLSLFGSIMVVSASMNRNATPLDLVISFLKQLLFLIVGYFCMVLLARYLSIKTLKKWMFYIVIITLVVLCVPLLFPARSGAQAWIVLPVFNMTIQPSEFAKIVVILGCAIYLGDIKRITASWWDIVKIPLLFVILATFIVIGLQSDLGTGVILFSMAWFMVLVPGAHQLRWMQRIMIILTVIGFVFIILLLSPEGIRFVERLPLSAYQINRFKDMFNPFINRYESSFQLFNSLIAFVKGNWQGIGFGRSVQKLGYLPVAQSDYILAIIVEEIGIAGFVLILIGYAVMITVLMKYAILAKTEQSKMILFGTALYLMLHFVLNVGGVSALIPLTGIPLLMISAGGSSQVAIMMAIGVSQGIIARHRTAKNKGEG